MNPRPSRRTTSAHEKQRIRDAEALLYREVSVRDPRTGEVTRQRIETQLYQDYLTHQTAYNHARMAYTAAMQKAHKTATGRNTWPLVAGTMQLQVKQAYDKWRAAGAGEIERALATIKNVSV
jgi:hypothetical protein